MKLIQLLFITSIVFISCQPKPGENTETRLREENFSLKRENDSLRNVVLNLQPAVVPDTISKLDEAVKFTPNYSTFTGEHALTLQWISWNEPGSATIEKTSNGWYKISGSQFSKNKENYLKINGRIKPINDRELEFDGQIESRIDHINNGDPCIKSGTQKFVASGNRKYWRLENMINCEGNLVTDYVDIYF
ncbi:MAG: Uncharacterized protein JWN56_1724 [Sphingobacteriales bacterium]|nr:Uncharacterized protein [Sphingobacteriales bacterium]